MNAPDSLKLRIEGMDCAACAVKIDAKGIPFGKDSGKSLGTMVQNDKARSGGRERLFWPACACWRPAKFDPKASQR